MKIFKILTISFCIIFLLTSNAFAIGDTKKQGDDFMDIGKANAGSTMDTDNLKDASGKVYNLLLAVATGTAVIVGAILGIKYMTAGINEKTDVKASLLPYMISCIIVFGSLGIWRLTVTIFKGVVKWF